MLRTTKRVTLMGAVFGFSACVANAPDIGGQHPVLNDTPALIERAESLLSADPQPDVTISYTNNAGKAFPINIFHAEGTCPVDGRPGLVMYHGGGWKSGKPDQFSRQSQLYNELGFTILMPAYSLENVDGTPPQQSLSDAISAWETIQAKAKELCLDPIRLGAGGGSAGGHLGAALVTVGNDKAPTIGTRPKLLLLFNPVIDNSPDGYGHERIGDDWVWFSPLHNIPEDHPDTLFLLGDTDVLIPVSTGKQYCDQVLATGADCQLIIYENAEHGWFNRTGFVDTLTDSAQFLNNWLSDPGSSD